MDRLFAEGATGRRRFLDRLVLAIDPAHAGARRALRALAARALAPAARRAGAIRPGWLRSSGASPRRGVAVAAARRELVSDLDAELRRRRRSLPAPRLALAGEVEAWLDDHAGPGGRAAPDRALAQDRDAGRRRPAAPRSVRTAATCVAIDARARRAGGALLDRPPEGLPDQHRPGRGRLAPAPPRRPADPAAGRGHGPPRPAPPRRAAGGPGRARRPVVAHRAPRPACSRRCERRRASSMS